MSSPDDPSMTAPRRVSQLAWLQLAPNPGPMTLDGTNTYLLRGDVHGAAVVVDPGPGIPAHVAAIAAAGPVELILITHHHLDHTEAARALREATGAPVRAPSAADCLDGEVFVGGERIEAAGLQIDVLATPGHTADSVCFRLPDDRSWDALPDGRVPDDRLPDPSDRRGSVLTGDTVLGRGSTVIGVPDGTLADYLDSLRRLRDLGPLLGLPAHGDPIADLSAACERYLAHRLARLDQVRQALRTLGLSAAAAGTDEGVAAVLGAVYPDVDPRVQFAAAFSVATQVAYLAEHG